MVLKAVMRKRAFPMITVTLALMLVAVPLSALAQHETGRQAAPSAPPSPAEIREIEQAIEAAESSVEAARDEVRLEVGIHDFAKFNELAAPIEAKHDAPWLRRCLQDGVEVIRVVDLEKGVERPATPDEIANGIVCPDFR